MRQNLIVAARQPLALLVLASAIGGGIFSANWLLPLGLVVYGAMVGLAMRDPAIGALAAKAERRAAVRAITSPTFRAMIDDIDRSQQEIERSVRQAPPALQRLLHGVSRQTVDLVMQAHDLAGKGEVIEQFLASIRYPQIQGDIDHLDRQMAATSDAYTIQQLQQTRQALVERRINAEALQTYIGRITAQLHNIDANLDNVLAETIRLRTSDAVSAGPLGSDVAEKLRDLNADMNAFQQVLDTAITQSQRP